MLVGCPLVEPGCGSGTNGIAMTAFTIEELLIPASVDTPDAADFIEATRVANDIEADIVGSYDLGWEPVELLPQWQNPYETQRMFIARADGRIVGRATYEVQSGENPRSAWVFVDVLPAHRRRGLGADLADRVEAIAESEGRSILQSFALHRTDAAGDRITSPTGFGSVPAGDEATRFLTSRGYRLAQVERASRLELPVTLPAAPRPDGYALEVWEGRTPERWISGLASMQASMSTDPPLGDLDYEPEEWTAQRVRDEDERNASSTRRWFTAAARHIESDSLVGFTQLAVPADVARTVFQWNTIVVDGHRGHRLGMMLKIANLERLASLAPGHPSVHTWNAEENRHMLAVNEALGFLPVAYPSNWRRDV